MGEKKQTFRIVKNNELIDGYYKLFSDSSLMYSIPVYGTFQLLLGEGYHMSLGVNRGTGECLSFYTLLAALVFEPFTFAARKIYKASLFFESATLETQEGDHYVPFVEKMYFDEKNSMLAFGDISFNGSLIEFSNNTYAALDGDQLTAVYVKVSTDIIDTINAHHRKRKSFFRFFR